MKQRDFALAFVLVLVGWAVYQLTPLDKKIKLGLDLQGGMHIVLRVATEELPENRQTEEERQKAVDRALEIMRNRVGKLGIEEPVIHRQGLDGIVIQLPGLKDPERARQLIGKTALLEFRLVAQGNPAAHMDAEGNPRDGFVILPSRSLDEEGLVLREKVLLDGSSLLDAYASVDEFGRPLVQFKLNPDGARDFSRLTAINVNRRLAIILDDVLYSAPVIQERIPRGEGVISGVGDLQEAKDLALVLSSGALPVRVVVEDQMVVGSTLGHDFLELAMKAGWIGLGAVILIMLVYYRVSGFIASLGLLMNLVLLMAILSKLGATFTLPGLGGIILTVGFATDANVLIFERIREEMGLGQTVRAAVERGYSQALSAIVDSQVTTIITCIMLFQFGSGPIRGFAVTLFWGVVINLFTAVFVTRTLFEMRKGGKTLSI